MNTQGNTTAQILEPTTGRVEGEQIFFDGKQLPLEGRGWSDTENYYERLPASAQENVREVVWDLSKRTSGLLYRFSTESPEIVVRWALTSNNFSMDHMPSTGVSGVDLYGLSPEGQWQYIPTATKLIVNQLENLTSFKPRQQPAYSQYLLYLPLYNGVRNFEIGIDRQASIRFEPKPQKQVLVYGTSITQGGCASRPGLSYTAILGRNLNVEVINLGFSGNGRIEPELAELISELKPDCLVIDPLWNNSPEDLNANYESFLRQVVTAHADKPIILVDRIQYTGQYPTEHGEITQRIMAKLQAEGADNLTFLPNIGMLGDDYEGTVDGTHPNDIGMLRIAKVLTPAVAAALNPQV